MNTGGGRSRNGGSSVQTSSAQSEPLMITSNTASAPGAVTLAQQAVVPGSDGESYPRITCCTCQGMGGTLLGSLPERRHNCNGKDVNAPRLHVLASASASGIDHEWILLDLQSTAISVFKNNDVLTNVRRSPHVLRALMNGGHQDSGMVGDFPNWGRSCMILPLLQTYFPCRMCANSVK